MRVLCSLGFAIAVLGSVSCSNSSKDESDAETHGRVVQLCVPSVGALKVERDIWKSFFSNPLTWRLLDNYMDCTGKTLNLRFTDLYVVPFEILIDGAVRKWAASSNIPKDDFQSRKCAFPRVMGTANGGTLGHFFTKLDGTCARLPNGRWTFVGKASATDVWDFNPVKNSFRATDAEWRTRMANLFLTGKPFRINFDSKMKAIFDDEPSVNTQVWFDDREYVRPSNSGYSKNGIEMKPPWFAEKQIDNEGR